MRVMYRMRFTTAQANRPCTLTRSKKRELAILWFAPRVDTEPAVLAPPAAGALAQMTAAEPGPYINASSRYGGIRLANFTLHYSGGGMPETEKGMSLATKA